VPRIAFAGTPQFAVPALAAVARLGAVPLVLTQPDRPAGRGRKLAASPVKAAAQRLGLALAQPGALGDPQLLATLGEPPDLLVVVAYGLLLPPWLLRWPRRGCVNVHASLLPRWRGAAPIQRAVLAGDAVTGISIMQMDQGLDTGPVYSQRETAIGAHETAGELHDRLAALGAAALEDALPGVLAGTLAAVPQDGRFATHAAKIGKHEAPLDWRRDAAALERQVRAFNPWPVAEAATEDGRRLRIFAAVATDGAGSAPPGEILAANAAGIDVATGGGVLRISRLQPPSGRVMDAEAYLAAHPLAGTRFVA
jgi:methionyl-tRNA formyltransferase